MKSCPDCVAVDEQVKGNDKYEIIDIGEHVRNLKAFLSLRDSHPAFEKVRQRGTVGIPCFVLEDGRVTLRPEDAGLTRNKVSRPETAGHATPTTTEISDALTTSSQDHTSEASATAGSDSSQTPAPACNLDGTGC